MDEATPAEGVSGEAAESLLTTDHSRDAVIEGRGQMRKDISNAMVGLKKQLYGKGPVKAKTFINDNIVFCVLEGGLTKNEETLLAAGEEHLVRQYRLRFQEVVANTAHEAVERITGCTVLTYHSQIVFGPNRMFEIFVLDREP
jgi:uncharacterized protein YbcI